MAIRGRKTLFDCVNGAGQLSTVKEQAMSFRILVVDDDADVRDVLTRFLKRRGYSVEHASDGKEALTRFARTSPISCCWTSTCRG